MRELTMDKKITLVDGRNCYIYEYADACAMLVQPVDDHDLEMLDEEVEAIRSLTDRAFILVAFEVKDWQTELTPWPAPAVFGKTPFGDGAAATLDFITHRLLPTLRQMKLPDEGITNCLLGGYSLAGLFSLWVGYQTAVFKGTAAVSPSVWYQGWTDFASANSPKASAVYLSLGDKEGKTRNPVMAQIVDCINKQYELLSAQGVNTILEWNAGNHFQDAAGRTAKGFAWLIRQLAGS